MYYDCIKTHTETNSTNRRRDAFTEMLSYLWAMRLHVMFSKLLLVFSEVSAGCVLPH